MKRALLYNFIAAVICYIGLVIGLIVGEATSANQWIFGLSGGIFVYIALADMVSKYKKYRNIVVIYLCKDYFVN